MYEQCWSGMIIHPEMDTSMSDMVRHRWILGLGLKSIGSLPIGAHISLCQQTWADENGKDGNCKVVRGSIILYQKDKLGDRIGLP